MAFTVAIAGRPNVGKSTLFNRLTGKSAAIVDDTPGVTRDWREADVELFNLSFRLLDTAGLDDVKTGDLSDRIQKQTRLAIEQADALIFLIDGREGVTPHDAELARMLRRAGKPIVLAVGRTHEKRSVCRARNASTRGRGISSNAHRTRRSRVLPRAMGTDLREAAACCYRCTWPSPLRAVHAKLVACLGSPPT